MTGASGRASPINAWPTENHKTYFFEEKTYSRKQTNQHHVLGFSFAFLLVCFRIVFLIFDFCTVLIVCLRKVLIPTPPTPICFGARYFWLFLGFINISVFFGLICVSLNLVQYNSPQGRPSDKPKPIQRNNCQPKQRSEKGLSVKGLTVGFSTVLASINFQQKHGSQKDVSASKTLQFTCWIMESAPKSQHLGDILFGRFKFPTFFAGAPYGPTRSVSSAPRFTAVAMARTTQSGGKSNETSRATGYGYGASCNWNAPRIGCCWCSGGWLIGILILAWLVIASHFVFGWFQ